MREVATLAGVSVATVSHVVNDTRRISPATRARVEQAIARLGFEPDPVGRMLSKRRGGERMARAGADRAPRADDMQRRADDVATQDQIGNVAIQNRAGDVATERADHVVVADAPGDLRPAQTGDIGPAQLSAYASAHDSAGTAKATRMLLRLVHAAQPISRAELARRLGVNRSTVTDAFKPLIAAGLVREGPLPQGAGVGSHLGRPPTGLSFNGEHDFFVGVSLGVRRSQVGLTTLLGEIIAEEEFVTPAEPAAALALIRASIERLRARAGARALRMIGVSVPGPTCAQRARLLYAPHLGWRDVAVADALRFETQTGEQVFAPVVVENDSAAAAIYEARLRLRSATEGVLKDFVLVRSGTGIGVGLVLGGEVYRGTGRSEGIAGEFGHTTIVAGGKPCVCGNRGCWEMYGSASAASALYVGDRVQLGGSPPPRYVEIVARAEAGELRARRTLERVGEYLGIGIGNVITGLGVPHVIVSGRIVYGWNFISEPLRAAVAQSMAGQLAGWSVEAGAPTGAGLGGALEVAVDEFLCSGQCA
jgi:predicted NBD/HSP70 family sugar kinase/plasmid maintenance system antidote protein VapI